MTTKILTVRISLEQYSALCAASATAGLPIATHVRNLIEHEHQNIQFSIFKSELLSKLELLSAESQKSSCIIDLLEIKLLCRSIASHLNPQLVTQVRAKLPQ